MKSICDVIKARNYLHISACVWVCLSVCVCTCARASLCVGVYVFTCVLVSMWNNRGVPKPKCPLLGRPRLDFSDSCGRIRDPYISYLDQSKCYTALR